MKIDIRGVIVSNDDKWIYDWLEMDSTAPKDVLPLIEKASGERLDVYINSGGGDLFTGSEIYAALAAYNGQIAIHITGMAGSAASVIAMAGQSDIAPTAMIMIHNVELGVSGDQNMMDTAGKIIRTANKAISAAYQLKTGKTEKELLAMMDASADNFGTWLTAKEAVEQKFVDQIAVNQNVKLAAAFGAPMLPPQLIDKLRALIKEVPARTKPTNYQIPGGQKSTAQAKLNFLKLGGKIV